MRGLGKAAEHVMHVVRDLGFEPSDSSRLGRMGNLFRNRDVIRETDSDFEVACEAVRDIRLLEFAFDQLVGSVPQETLRKKIQLVVKDAPLPQDDLVDTPGRNTQSELHVAATARAAGLRPTFDEPDVVVSFEDNRYGLAVKRLKTLKQLQKRFGSAVDQIERSALPGFVVLDMVLALNPDNARLWPIIKDDQFLRAHGVYLERFLKPRWDCFIRWRRGREVRGLVVLDHVVRKLQTGGWGLSSFTFFVHLDRHNLRRKREAYRFWDIYLKGIPDAVNIS